MREEGERTDEETEIEREREREGERDEGGDRGWRGEEKKVGQINWRQRAC